MRVPPDIEAAMVALLPGSHSRVPNPRPEEFTKVSAAGGTELNIIQGDPRVLVECFADDEVTAFERAQDAWGRVKAAEQTFVNGVWINGVNLTWPVNYPDPTTRQARYQFVAQLTTSLQSIT